MTPALSHRDPPDFAPSAWPTLAERDDEDDASGSAPSPLDAHGVHAAALLLNASYEPLRVVPWRRAVVLSFLDRVEVLEVHTLTVRTVACTFPLPAVLRLPARVPMHARFVPFSRSNVYARDRSTCQYCGRRCPARELSYDHVVPRTRGGRTDWTNVVACCLSCNRRKGNRTPDEAGMRLRARPVRPTGLLLSLDVPVGRIPPPWEPYLGACAHR